MDLTGNTSYISPVMTDLSFLKMHGLGNDFVVIDARHTDLVIGAAEARAIGDRRRGVGFDQLLIIEPAKKDKADVFMRILNPDGSNAEACGNGTRCVAARIMDELKQEIVVVETVAGLLTAQRGENGLVCVDMGPASIDWRDIPLAREADTLTLDVHAGPLGEACCVNMGNPHAVFFVDDAEAVVLEQIGPELETHRMFPERANIEVVSVISENKLRMRVWERGAGITQACGSGACAVAVAAHRRGVTARKVEVVLDGGSLFVEWREDNRVLMTGPVATSYRGVLDPTLLNNPA